jgi:uncharacterized protein (DUF1015 family)
MAIKPFRAWRPAKDKVHLVASRSYVTYTPAQLRRKLEENPYTFLHIIHPDGTSRMVRTELDARFQKVRERFHEFCDEGVLLREERPAFYIYEQITPTYTSIGVIAGVPVTDYHEKRIKKHEQTLTKREALFARYLSVTGINAEPVLLSTKTRNLTTVLRNLVKGTDPDYDFSTANKHRHKLWIASETLTIERITKAVGDQNLYIADGHHRSASSALIAEQILHGPGNHFMALVVDPESLHIHNYDRAVRDMGNITVKQLLEQLASSSCRVEEVDKHATPDAGSVIMLTPINRYRITLPKNQASSAQDATDAALLNDQILRPYLGIADVRNDKRIQFIPGDGTPNNLQLLLDQEKIAIGFWMHPVPFDQLTEVADENGIMPPKSTWIEPKLRSGLTIYSLMDE